MPLPEPLPEPGTGRDAMPRRSPQKSDGAVARRCTAAETQGHAHRQHTTLSILTLTRRRREPASTKPSRSSLPVNNRIGSGTGPALEKVERQSTCESAFGFLPVMAVARDEREKCDGPGWTQAEMITCQELARCSKGKKDRAKRSPCPRVRDGLRSRSLNNRNDQDVAVTSSVWVGMTQSLTSV